MLYILLNKRIGLKAKKKKNKKKKKSKAKAKYFQKPLPDNDGFWVRFVNQFFKKN
jgi:hypothetical protein